MQVISAARSEWIAPFTGLEPRQFRKLVAVVARRGGEAIADGRPGRQWRLRLEDRVLLVDAVAIVDGALVPTRDRRLAAPSKNYRYSANLQVAIDADSRLVVAIGDPQPGNRNDCTVYRESGIDRELAGRAVMADGGYQGNTGVIMPYRKRSGGQPLPDWQEELNATHRKVRARVEHALAGMKCWKILRDYRRAASTLATTASGIAHLRNLALDA
ncbi:transposase family protein [Saccharopolyspora cebuensis]|uniref:Transposase family protein n=1 Tax=Saccharopolyspora cebuensis TaxID=418759 RepID=A0ABV4CML7_9PSEU